MLPADELHQIRARIRALQAREAALKAMMLADPGGPACHGRDWEAVVHRRRARRLDFSRLPEALRADPWVYRESVSRAVLLRPAVAAALAA